MRRAVRIPPAEAMRPEPPPRYRRAAIETRFVRTPPRHRRRGWSCATSSRHPFRAAASIVGIAFAVAILMVGFVFIDAIERLILTQFWDAERQDVTVTFVEPRSERARYELARAARRDRGGAAARRCRCACARDTASATWRSPACLTTPGCKRIVDRDGRPIRPSAVGPRALEDPGAGARRDGPVTL